MSVPEVEAPSLLEGVFTALPVAAVVCDLSGQIVCANPAFAALAGRDVPHGAHWCSMVTGDDYERLATEAGAALDDDVRRRWSDRIVRVGLEGTDGRVTPVELRLGVAALGDRRLIVATATSIDERRRQETQLRASETRLRALETALPVGVIASHAGLRAHSVNERCAELFEAAPDELVGFGWLDRIHEDDADAVVAALEEAVTSLVESELDVRLVVGLRSRPMRLRITPVRAGPDVGYVASFEQLAVDAGLAAELEWELRTDPLTGLANRRVLWEALAELDAVDGRHPAACFVDLDDFKAVNDRFGHEAGDELLREVARRLVRASREGDVVCRFGGDEFVVVLPHVSTAEMAVAVGQRIVESIAGPVDIAGHTVDVSASVGVVWTGTPELGAPGEGGDLLRAADVALYQAKRTGKNRAALFDSSTHQADRRRRDEREAVRAVLDGTAGALVTLRPMIRLTDGVTVATEVGVALDGRLPLSPAAAATVAAEAGLAVPWDRFTLGVAASLTERLRGSVAERIVLALSSRSLYDGALVADLAGLARRQPLLLAVTEAVASGPDGRAVAALTRLRASGAAVALRRVGGTGSGFSTLRVVPFDSVELDASLAAAVGSDPKADASVAGIVATVVAMGATATAPEVIDEDHARRLAELGVAHHYGRWHGGEGIDLGELAEIAS